MWLKCYGLKKESPAKLAGVLHSISYEKENYQLTFSSNIMG